MSLTTQIFFYRAEDFGGPVPVTRGEHAGIANDDPCRRHYFYLLFKHGEGAVLAEGPLARRGASSFRDLVGYETGSGERLKW